MFVNTGRAALRKSRSSVVSIGSRAQDLGGHVLRMD